MSDIINAIKQICEEKGLSYDSVIMTIESALAAAYRKDYGEKNQNIKVEYDPATNTSHVYDEKLVVENQPEEPETEENELAERAEVAEIAEVSKSKNAKAEPVETLEVQEASLMPGASPISTAQAKSPNEPESESLPEPETEEGEEGEHRFNPKTELEIKEALLVDPDAKIGDTLRIDLPTKDEYGPMAAQTAKQVIIQRLREAERDMVFGEFKDKEHEVISGVVQRREGRIVLVDLGKTSGIILPEDQIRGERYNHNDRIKVYVREVRNTPKGPEILLSRTSDEILKKVFYLEIPEVSNGLIEIKAVAREAGSRSKVAVEAYSENIDPIGSCVGQRGSRIQTIIRELGGEKIDIIEYSEDPAEFIAYALSPAKISSVQLNEADKRALVKVAEDQLSLAIGKSGQNVRLAAYLTGWKIDIVEAETGQVKETAVPEGAKAVETEPTENEAKELAEEAEVAHETAEAIIEESPTEKPKKAKKPAAESEEGAVEKPKKTRAKKVKKAEEADTEPVDPELVEGAEGEGESSEVESVSQILPTEEAE